MLKQLKTNESNAVNPNPAEYNGEGYGRPSTYKLPLKPGYNGKSFGTHPGESLSIDTTTLWDYDDSNEKSLRRDSNVGKTATKQSNEVNDNLCDPSYLMITAMISDLATGNDDITVKLRVQQQDFRPTFYYKIPTRPAAVKAPLEKIAIDEFSNRLKKLPTFIIIIGLLYF